MMVRVTALRDEKRHLYIQTDAITAVIGPVHNKQPLGPGKEQEEYRVTVYTSDGINHSVDLANEKAALFVMHLLTKPSSATQTDVDSLTIKDYVVGMRQL